MLWSDNKSIKEVKQRPDCLKAMSESCYLNILTDTGFLKTVFTHDTTLLPRLEAEHNKYYALHVCMEECCKESQISQYYWWCQCSSYLCIVFETILVQFKGWKYMRHGRRLRCVVSACLFLLCDKLGTLSLQTMSTEWLTWHFIAHDVMAL